MGHWPKLGSYGKNRIFCPKTTKFSLKLAFLSIAGSFGALLLGWLVVAARGLYLARHLFTLFYVKEVFNFPNKKVLYNFHLSNFPTIANMKNSPIRNLVHFFLRIWGLINSDERTCIMERTEWFGVVLMKQKKITNECCWGGNLVIDVWKS